MRAWLFELITRLKDAGNPAIYGSRHEARTFFFQRFFDHPSGPTKYLF
jgi:hypothetical protein